MLRNLSLFLLSLISLLLTTGLLLTFTHCKINDDPLAAVSAHFFTLFRIARLWLLTHALSFVLLIVRYIYPSSFFCEINTYHSVLLYLSLSLVYLLLKLVLLSVFFLAVRLFCHVPLHFATSIALSLSLSLFYLQEVFLSIYLSIYLSLVCVCVCVCVYVQFSLYRLAKYSFLVSC
jgi:hypothetical protein